MGCQRLNPGCLPAVLLWSSNYVYHFEFFCVCLFLGKSTPKLYSQGLGHFLVDLCHLGQQFNTKTRVYCATNAQWCWGYLDHPVELKDLQGCTAMLVLGTEVCVGCIWVWALISLQPQINFPNLHSPCVRFTVKFCSIHI